MSRSPAVYAVLALALCKLLHATASDNCPCHGVECSCGTSYPQYCGHNDMCSCIDHNQECCGADGDYCTSGETVCSDCPYNSPLPCTKTKAAHFADGCCPSDTSGLICSGHGNCTRCSSSGHTCTCEFGWGGRNCGVDCSASGTCQPRSVNGTAMCGDHSNVMTCKSMESKCQWVCGTSCEAKPGHEQNRTFCETKHNAVTCLLHFGVCTWGPPSLKEPLGVNE